ncbi:hypothetical protein [Arthrobacter rhombi]|uniref:hypothetical protein n=1 Tax=Arthrobacter rhombi TaxID=71253 RepID=UPI003FD1AA92
MIIWSIVQWPAMEPSIVTREAAGNHGTSTVPRAFTACAMPTTLAVLTVLLAFAPRIDGCFLKLLGDFGTANPRDRAAAPRVLGIVLIGFSVLLTTLHVVFVSLHTQSQLPILSLTSTAIGLFLFLLGVALPQLSPQAVTGSEAEARLRIAQRRTYPRIAPIVMFTTGASTILAAWFGPVAAMPIAVGGVILLFATVAIVSIAGTRNV